MFLYISLKKILMKHSILWWNLTKRFVSWRNVITLTQKFFQGLQFGVMYIVCHMWSEEKSSKASLTVDFHCWQSYLFAMEWLKVEKLTALNRGAKHGSGNETLQSSFWFIIQCLCSTLFFSPQAFFPINCYTRSLLIPLLMTPDVSNFGFAWGIVYSFFFLIVQCMSLTMKAMHLWCHLFPSVHRCSPNIRQQ